MSRMRVGAVPQYTVLCLPDNVTAWMHHCSPDTAAENHTSFPEGAHANPSRDSHPLDMVFTCPDRLTSTRSPRSSTLGGCRNTATCFPSGETRISLIQPSP